MPQLLGGEDVELLPRQPADLRPQNVDAGLELFPEVGQGLAVHQHPRPLHPGQHRTQGQLNVRQHGQQAVFLQPGPEQIVKCLDPGRVLIPGGLGLQPLVQQGEGGLVLVGGGQLHFLFEVGCRQLPKLIAPRRGVQQVGGQLRIEYKALRLNPLVQQGAAQLLDTVGGFFYRGAKQRRQKGVVVPPIPAGADVVQVRLPAAVPGQGHRHPRQPRQGQDGDARRPLPFGQGGGEIRLSEDGHVRHPDLIRPLLLRGPCRAGGELQLVDELTELQLQQLLVQNRLVKGPPGRVLRVKVHGGVGADDGQVIAHPGVPLPLHELFDDARLGVNIRELFIDGVHRPILPDQRHGGLLPHPLDAGVVVGGIPHQRL